MIVKAPHLRSGQNKAELISPMIEFPDGRGGNTSVHRVWELIELLELLRQLPNPKEHASAWADGILEIDSLYMPNKADVEQLMKKAPEADWAVIKGRVHFDDVEGQANRHAIASLIGAITKQVTEKYPKQTNFENINRCVQGVGEDPSAYLDRLMATFRKKTRV